MELEINLHTSILKLSGQISPLYLAFIILVVQLMHFFMRKFCTVEYWLLKCADMKKFLEICLPKRS